MRGTADLQDVDFIMQQCISDSSQKNLKLLRRGAFWVNQVMARLAKDGLGYLAYEIFVLDKF